MIRVWGRQGHKNKNQRDQQKRRRQRRKKITPKTFKLFSQLRHVLVLLVTYVYKISGGVN